MTGLGPGQPLPVPERLRDLLDTRLVRLSPASRDAVLLASMLSRPTVARIAAASDQALSTRAGLAEAEAGGVIEIDDPAIRFTHPLFASVIQARLNPGARRSLHGRLGDALPEGEERAYHLALAATGPDPDLADGSNVPGARPPIAGHRTLARTCSHGLRR